MNAGYVVLFIILGFVVIQIIGGYRDSKARVICRSCGSRGFKTITPGSVLIEIILWCCFLIPGLIYSIWRMSARYKACNTCEANSIMPLDTPAGRELAQRYPETH